jgi:hypothetical protein
MLTEGLCDTVTVPGDQEILLHWRRQTSAMLSARLLSPDDILSAAAQEPSTPTVVLPSCSLTAGFLTQVRRCCWPVCPAAVPSPENTLSDSPSLSAGTCEAILLRNVHM